MKVIHQSHNYGRVTDNLSPWIPLLKISLSSVQVLLFQAIYQQMNILPNVSQPSPILETSGFLQELQPFRTLLNSMSKPQKKSVLTTISMMLPLVIVEQKIWLSITLFSSQNYQKIKCYLFGIIFYTHRDKSWSLHLQLLVTLNIPQMFQ